MGNDNGWLILDIRAVSNTGLYARFIVQWFNKDSFRRHRLQTLFIPQERTKNEKRGVVGFGWVCWLFCTKGCIRCSLYLSHFFACCHLSSFSNAYRVVFTGPAVRIPLMLCVSAGPAIILRRAKVTIHKWLYLAWMHNDQQLTCVNVLVELGWSSDLLMQFNLIFGERLLCA